MQSKLLYDLYVFSVIEKEEIIAIMLNTRGEN